MMVDYLTDLALDLSDSQICLHFVLSVLEATFSFTQFKAAHQCFNSPQSF